ncbi:Lsr2 family DNA-binding protein [Streptomyces aureocirculatus]|uniref:Lsr2 family DNA-binding protein n=1 Tax=Streptomyces aureocirculatus TaxID=67275 RepID=UPI0004C813F8|nr:histone-like nucleoid-structuring protein Lsr2 [Streptomyces aureocirculatus]
MTIAALGALLNEIDRQGGPEAARQGRLHLDDTEPRMHSAPAPATATVPGEDLPVGALLKWADDHDDPDVQDQAARTRADLAGLRRRYATDHDLARITSETEQLEQRLAELRARQHELAPPPRTERKAPAYRAAEVRTWARENNLECATQGRVPKPIVEAWRAAHAPAGTP